MYTHTSQTHRIFRVHKIPRPIGSSDFKSCVLLIDVTKMQHSIFMLALKSLAIFFLTGIIHSGKNESKIIKQDNFVWHTCVIFLTGNQIKFLIEVPVSDFCKTFHEKTEWQYWTIEYCLVLSKPYFKQQFNFLVLEKTCYFSFLNRSSITGILLYKREIVLKNKNWRIHFND